ncbi:MAG TPA: hypothetical protein DCE24_08915 [Porphyromonadaceae bacterium]|nr:hypothetical protein [Paramuribaculum sp.]HAB41962.1 hypothetical protein [Porphyromonadaceae bacterium]
MKKIAQIISFVFSPLIVPTYGVAAALWLSMLSLLPSVILWRTLGYTFALTCLFPMIIIFIMWKIGYLSDPGLNKRTERTLPYIVVLLGYLGCAYMFYRMHAPVWLTGFMIGGSVAVIVSIFVNRWWKISAHMAAMGGALVMTFRLLVSNLAVVDMLWPIVIAVVCTGLVCTARVGLRRHTLMQVLAGTANGFIWTYLLSGIGV